MFVSKNCCMFLVGDRKRWENLRNVFIITFILYVLLWSGIVMRSLNMAHRECHQNSEDGFSL